MQNFVGKRNMSFCNELFQKKTCYRCTTQKLSKYSIFAQNGLKMDILSQNARFSRFLCCTTVALLFLKKLVTK